MIDRFITWFDTFFPTLVFALIVLLVGYFLTKLTLKIITKGLIKKGIDKTGYSFIKSFVKVILYVFIALIALSILNVPVNSLLAAVATSGLAIGLALQDTLSNIVGGFVILFNKPFVQGDLVQIGTECGNVDSISVFYTKLLTFDNKAIFIPNGTVSKSNLINFTNQGIRRLDLNFSISYNEDFTKAIAVISDVVAKNQYALKSPEPVIRVNEHGASAIIIVCRVWVNCDDYWNLNYDLLESVKKAFDTHNIEIPYNKLDVNLIK